MAGASATRLSRDEKLCMLGDRWNYYLWRTNEVLGVLEPPENLVVGPIVYIVYCAISWHAAPKYVSWACPRHQGWWHLNTQGCTTCRLLHMRRR